MAMVFVAPFAPDPIEFAVGAFVPWPVPRIVGTLTLRAAFVFFLLRQWLQVYARVLVSIGLVVTAACRYFMVASLPWMVREEISMPKLLGAAMNNPLLKWRRKLA
ncbi:MAG: hypothetical protein HYX38_06880 [Rhodospirillales bacterium]|nr:hypothetical protein [Rhodospirillales bacterium]